jgi:hypothetical protein
MPANFMVFPKSAYSSSWWSAAKESRWSSPEEAALGRITRFVPSGLLATAEGEDYVNTMQRRKQDVPEDLKHSGQVKLHRINGYRDIGGRERAAA